MAFPLSGSWKPVGEPLVKVTGHAKADWRSDVDFRCADPQRIRLRALNTRMFQTGKNLEHENREDHIHKDSRDVFHLLMLER